MKYTFSVDIQQIEASSEDEAFTKAHELIKQGFYDLQIVDEEEAENE